MPYESLLSRSSKLARRVIECCNKKRQNARLRYLTDQCTRLARVAPVNTAVPHAGPAARALDLMEENLSSIISEEATGPDIVGNEKGLWTKLMTEWPVGMYAAMTADVLRSTALLGGRVLELGAGVGATTRLLGGDVSSDFVRTDVNARLLGGLVAPGAAWMYDFNTPGKWKDFDVVFAVCSLHCANDKALTLKYIKQMLRPGGILVLGEGEPHTDKAGAPWALNPLFGLFDGWWDVSGFVSRRQWLSDLDAAGFTIGGVTRWREAGHDLGGVIWAKA